MSISKNTKESILIYSSIILLIVLAIGGAWLTYNVPVVGVGLMIISTIISYIVLYKRPRFLPVGTVNDIVLGSVVVVVVCICFMVTQNGRYKASISELFLEGKIIKGKVLVESDEGSRYYEDTYTFRARKGQQDAVEIIKWSLMAISIITLFLNWKFLGKSNALKEQHDPKPKYRSSY